MALIRKNRFYSGELSPRAAGNDSLDEYDNGLETLENMIILPQGGVKRRNGTSYVAEVKTSAKVTRLIPFEFSEDDSYVLEFGDLYIRLYKNTGLVVDSVSLLSNYTFDSNVTSWTAAGVGASIAWNGGLKALDLTLGSNNNGWAYQSFTLGAPATVNFSCDLITSNAATHSIGIGTTSTNMDEALAYFSSGSASGSVALGAGTFYFTAFGTGVAGNIATFDNCLVVDAVGAVEVTTTYVEADINKIQYAQSADVLYLTHPDYIPRKLVRTDDTTWAISDVDMTRQPFRDDDLDNTVTLTASAVSGSGITVTASAATFTADHVGSTWRHREPSIGAEVDEWRPSTGSIASILGVMPIVNGDRVTYNGNLYSALVATSTIDVAGTLNTGSFPPVHTSGTASDGSITWTYVSGSSGTFKITAFGSSTSVTADVVDTLPSTSATTYWEEPPWSDEKGWPASVCFHEERLWMGATYNSPQTIWGTQTGDFENWEFGAGDEGDACEYTIASNAVNRIQWLQSGVGLFIGTLGGEYVATGASRNEGITPRSIRISPHSRHGSRRLMTRLVSNAVVFIQKSGTRIRRFLYDYDVDAYVSEDLSLMSEHITESGIVQLDYQQEPDSVLWSIRDDGELAACTLQRELNLKGWHRHILGGTLDSGQPEVMSVAVIPNGDFDQAWFIAKRTINSSTVQYIEKMNNWKDTDDLEDAILMDSAVSYSGTSTTAMTGLGHLEGESVEILADGLVQANKTVSSGAITLATAASVVHMGLHKTSTVKTLNLFPENSRSVVQGKVKRISEVIVRFLNTTACKLNGDSMDFTAGELFSGDKSQNYTDSHDFESKVIITADTPLPMTILSLYPRISDKGR